MRWIWKFFNIIYKNLTKCLMYILGFFIFVFFTSFSAQYLGETIGERILSNKRINVVIAYDKKDNEMEHLVKQIIKDNILSENHIKFKITSNKGGKELTKNKFEIVITDTTKLMEELIERKLIGSYPIGTIPIRSKQYIKLSKYGEYVTFETSFGKSFNIAIASGLDNMEEAKTLSALKLISDNWFRKTTFEPDYSKGDKYLPYLKIN